VIVGAPGHAREVELNAAEAIMLLGDLRPAERPAPRAEALQLLTPRTPPCRWRG
jgi:hypothetical protein